MKTFRMDFSGGMTFKGQPEGPQVRLLDNAQVMGNIIESHRIPVPTGPRAPNDTAQIFWYRGRFLYSAQRRSYLPEYSGGNERVIWTEYGTYPKKQINKFETYLGVIRPALSPSLGAGPEIVMAPPTISEVPGGGSFAKDARRQYRVALKTDYGVLPPSGKSTITATASQMAFLIQWGIPDLPIPITGVMVFGCNEGEERTPLLADLGIQSTSFTDSGVGSAVLDYAENYDFSSELQYTYTFFQDLDGLTAESAPSPLTPFISGQSSRMVVMSTAVDGYWDQKGIQAETLSQTDLEETINSVLTDITFESATDLNGETYSLDDLYFDPYEGFAVAHFTNPEEGVLVAKGEVLLASGWGGHALDNCAIRVWKTEEEGTQVWLDLTEDQVGQGIIGGALLQRITLGSITASEYNATSKMVIFTTAAPHTFKESDRIKIKIEGDLNFDDRVFEVIRIWGEEEKFGIRNCPIPKVQAGTWERPITRIRLKQSVRESNERSFPDTDEYLRMNYILTSDTGTVHAAYPTCFRAPGALYLSLRSGTAFTTGEKINQLSIEWYTRNNGILYRSLYRTGDTAEFLKVDDIPIDLDEYFDYRDTMNLGMPIPSYRITNGKAILSLMPPETLECFDDNYGITFAIDGHDVRWSEANRSDSWPDAYKQRFPYKPVAIKSYNQAMVVLCEDRLYRLDGSDPDYLTISGTLAEDGCIARNTVQKTHRGLVYAGKRGIYLFDGQNSVCVTEHRADAGQLFGTAHIEGDSFWWLPNADTKAFAHALYADFDGLLQHEILYQEIGEGGGQFNEYWYPMIHVEWIGTWIDLAYNLDSFVWDGCYYLYASSLDPNYNGMGMWMMDLRREGFPLYHCGLHPVHVHVSDLEEVHVLMPAGPAATTVVVEELP